MDIQACETVVAGGGIGGLAAALALSRQGAAVRLIEQASAFAEVGAGIQIGPNVTRILRAWGLETGLRRVAAFPQVLLAPHMGSATIETRDAMGMLALDNIADVLAGRAPRTPA